MIDGALWSAFSQPMPGRECRSSSKQQKGPGKGQHQQTSMWGLLVGWYPDSKKPPLGGTEQSLVMGTHAQKLGV